MSEETPVPEPVPIHAVPEKTLYLGTWSTRFWAWLIDFILVILFLNIVRGFLHRSGSSVLYRFSSMGTI